MPAGNRLTLQDVTTPFQVTAYDGASSRKSLDLRSTPALRDFCARLDAKLEPLARRLGNITYTSLLTLAPEKKAKISKANATFSTIELQQMSIM